MITVIRTTPDIHLELQLTAAEKQVLEAHNREQLRRHDLVMAHIRAVSQAVEPAPSNHWLARFGRCIARHL